MVPYRQSANQPLLPFEKRLIQELGCSEAEYRQFAQKVANKVYERPEEYANIPDIQNIPAAVLTPLLISLAVGIISSAASFLLTPKPKQASRTSFGAVNLGSTTGKEIYNPNFGFDSLQDLAAYGDIVPIVFTRQQTNVDEVGTQYTSGGLLISPSLVWSRVKSWGNYQIVEIVGVAGQGDMAKPDLAGIYLGNNALDSIYKDFFDFYWNGGYETALPGSRLRIQNLRYGELSIDDGLGSVEEAFYSPTLAGASQPAFSGTFTPSSQTKFGVYSGIANGTPVRPDWQVVSVLQGGSADQIVSANNNQRKYVDDYLMREHPYGGGLEAQTDAGRAKMITGGMPGTGRNYARRIGVIQHTSGSTGTVTTQTETRTKNAYGEKWTNLTREVLVEYGDYIVVMLGEGRQLVNPYPPLWGNIDPLNLQDIQSSVEADVKRVDQEMRRGATYMIGRSVWQVVDRPENTYDPTTNSGAGFRITLKCIEAWSNNFRKVGIVSRAAINEAASLPYADIDENFYPLLKYQIGSFQNNRRCDVTEIGIKSQVWCKFNGITNFNTLKAAGIMAQYNQKNIQLTEGKLTQYARRISVFALDARPSDTETVRTFNANEGWVNLGPYLFAVIGDSPTDIYSFIRVTHPVRSQFEYRLRPFNSAAVGLGDYDVFALDGGVTPYKEWSADSYMGTFRVGGRGKFVRLEDYFDHDQMTVIPKNSTTVSSSTGFGPDYTQLGVNLQSITCLTAGPGYNVGDPILFNTLSNIMAIFFGEDPYFDNLPNGSVRVKSGWNYAEQNRFLTLTITVESFEQAVPGTPRNRWWRIVASGMTLVNGLPVFGGNWTSGEEVVIKASNVSGVQFGFKYLVTFPTIASPVTGQTSRQFQKYSGIAEVSHYGDLISRSCDRNAEHEIMYVNESVTEDITPQYENCAMVGLKLRSSENFTQLDQLRCFMKDGIEVERLSEGDTGPSNLLSDLLWYLVTNTDTGAGKIIDSSLVDRDALERTGRFLMANRLFFDDAIADPINLRSWLAEIAPSVLCYTTLKNGKLSIEPAVPYDSNYMIDGNTTVHISAMFTDGNIIDGSFSLEWLDLEDRKLFQAAIRYRRTEANKVPEQRTTIVRYNTADRAELPLEEFTLNHVTGSQHAIKTARYFLALRKHVSHSVTFKTLPWGLSLAPGNFIRVTTQMSPYSPTNNGIVKPDGTVVSALALADGSWTVYYWDRNQTNVQSGVLLIANGVAQNLRNTVFSVINANATSQIYQIEALEVDTDGIVTIKASNYPVDSSGRSLIARDVVDADAAFEVVGGYVG